MAKRNLSDAEIRRRKQLQGKISQTTSTLGLAGVGVGTAAVVASKKPGSLKYIRKAPGLKKATAAGLKDTGLYTSLASGGIGGVGGYNFAAYTRAESRKRGAQQPKKRVQKGMDMGVQMGYFGEEGRQIKLPEIKVPIEKAWSPSASNYDPEQNRKRRGKAYEGAALVGAGGAGVYSGMQAGKAVKAAEKVKTVKASRVSTKTTQTTDAEGKKVTAKHKKYGKPFKALDVARSSKAVKHGGKAALGATGVVGAAALHGSLKRRQKESWQPYAKRDATSAWGIDHTE